MMSWTSDDQSETFDGADTSRGDDYTRGAHDSTGIRFELDALVVTLVVALGGALLDALLLHTLRTQLRSTLAPSGPEASGADGSDSATAQRSRRAGVEAAQSKSMGEREGERRATALPIALLMSNCVCSAVQCAFAVPAVTIEVFLPGTRSKLDTVCSVLFAFEHLLFAVPFWNVVAATAGIEGVPPPEEPSGARDKRSLTSTMQKPAITMSRLEFSLRIALPWLVAAVCAVAVAVLTFTLDPTAEWERALHGDGSGPGAHKDLNDLKQMEEEGVIRRNRGTGAEYLSGVCIHRSDVAGLVGRVSCFFVPAFFAGCSNCKALYEHYTLSGRKHTRRRSTSGRLATKPADLGRGIMNIGLLAMGPSAPPAAISPTEAATCPPECACRCHSRRGTSASQSISRMSALRTSRAVRRFSNSTRPAQRAASTLSRSSTSRSSRGSSRRVAKSATDSEGQRTSFGDSLLFSTLTLLIATLSLGPYVADEMLQSLCICSIRSKLHPGYNFPKNQRFSCGGLMGNVHLLSALKWLAYLHSLIAPLSALAASGELRAAALSSLVCYDPDASMPEELERRFSFGAAAAAAALFEDSPTAEYADTASAARRASEFTSSADSFSSRRLSPPVTRRAARNRKLLLRRVSEEAEGESGDARTAVTSPVAAARDQSNGANTSRSPVAHSDVEDERCRLLWVERREGPYEMRQVQEEMQTPDEKSELVINGRNRILL